MTDRRCYAHANLPNAGPGNQSVGVGQNLYFLYAESLAPACDGVDPIATRCSGGSLSAGMGNQSVVFMRPLAGPPESWPRLFPDNLRSIRTAEKIICPRRGRGHVAADFETAVSSLRANHQATC
jgi:hypothetical protein